MQNGLMVEFGAEIGDLGVQGLDADAQEAGLCFTRAIIFSRGKASEVGEDLLVAEGIAGFMDCWIGACRDGRIGGFMNCWPHMRLNPTFVRLPPCSVSGAARRCDRCRERNGGSGKWIDGFMDRATGMRSEGGILDGGVVGVCFHNSFVFLALSLKKVVGQRLSHLENSFGVVHNGEGDLNHGLARIYTDERKGWRGTG